MSVPDRRAMLDRADRTLSIRRQCALVGVARSSVYRPRRPANDNDVAAAAIQMAQACRAASDGSYLDLIDVSLVTGTRLAGHHSVRSAANRALIYLVKRLCLLDGDQPLQTFLDAVPNDKGENDRRLSFLQLGQHLLAQFLDRQEVRDHLRMERKMRSGFTDRMRDERLEHKKLVLMFLQSKILVRL